MNSWLGLSKIFHGPKSVSEIRTHVGGISEHGFDPVQTS